jgi:hypothetical protein
MTEGTDDIRDSPMARAVEAEQVQRRLREFAQLRDEGLITDEDYEELKRKQLDRIR